jgi:5'(3')-deoxyribonucleotidase
LLLPADQSKGWAALMLTVLLDIDGVIADFVGRALVVIHQLSGNDRCKRSDVTDHDMANVFGVDEKLFNAACSTPGFCASIKPYPGALAILDHLRQAVRVVAVTAPFPKAPHWQHERREFLLDIGFKHADIISCADKSMIRGSVLIDDNERNCNSWAGVNYPTTTRTILINRPWNKSKLIHRDVKRGSFLKAAQLAADFCK